MSYQLIVIGGGPAGLAAARSAWEAGLRRILLVERDNQLGGTLRQCTQKGFGQHYFGEDLTGPEYAERFIRRLEQTGVEVACNTMVLEITPDKVVKLVSATMGYQELTAEALILATGCREQTRGAIGIPGYRPAGVLTAGAAQYYMNVQGYLPGRRAVLLGSDNLGLVTARRMKQVGAEVLACAESMPHTIGSTGNIKQCLEEFDIPLYLSHTITEIRGHARVTDVTLMQVDENHRPIPGTEKDIECDTVLISVGLIPETELGRRAGLELDPVSGALRTHENFETSIPGIFACGNGLRIHDLVDIVTEESQIAGREVAHWVLEGTSSQSGDQR